MRQLKKINNFPQQTKWEGNVFQAFMSNRGPNLIWHFNSLHSYKHEDAGFLYTRLICKRALPALKQCSIYPDLIVKPSWNTAVCLPSVRRIGGIGPNLLFNQPYNKLEFFSLFSIKWILSEIHKGEKHLIKAVLNCGF